VWGRCLLPLLNRVECDVLRWSGYAAPGGETQDCQGERQDGGQEEAPAALASRHVGDHACPPGRCVHSGSVVLHDAVRMYHVPKRRWNHWESSF